jgi:Uma2 family endonuclease
MNIQAQEELPPDVVALLREVESVELVAEDGENLESDWHRRNMNLLTEVIDCRLRGRDDYFVGGNMFIYFNLEQARNRDFRGPDFFFVWGARRTPLREYWAVWQEHGKYPHVIIELLSPRTEKEDLGRKKDVYEGTFHTSDYFCYDPYTKTLQGWHLFDSRYQPLTASERGWRWCEQLGLWLGTWEGRFQNQEATWLRFYTPDGQVVPTFAEAQTGETEGERQRAEAERQRAEAAEAEIDRLRAQLGRLPNGPGGAGSV